ncbi:leukemia inhibitory factor receptor-like isoform X2 [Alosa sapidissima]|uniref:leukemia inhibitory factor receptor-like isoform X2 n=1 Tax=Alosa sapidissima TaxID=34773 RepID=UPI001C0A650D|nr:leukemia inhibitory factor receptor-like isoform X2 [Alosa sapidissima]
MITSLLLTSFLIQAAEGMQNVPQLQDVRGDISTNGIDVSWTDEPSFVSQQENVIYDIEVYYPEQTEPVYRESIERRSNISHHWHWTSPLPLQCLRHSVRLRHHNASEWTDRKYVTGSDPDYSELPVIYPRDNIETAVLADSQKKFCCITPNGTTLKDFTYDDRPMKSIRVGQTYIVDLLMEATGTGGSILYCEVKRNYNAGSVVYVGYSPEVHNFTCETRNLRHLECSWTQGRDKNLRGVQGTKYTLNERYYCHHATADRSLHKKCSIEIFPNQGEVAWTLTAENKINKTSFTYTADPRHRVYLRAPQRLEALNVNSRNASIQWDWSDANLMLLSMRCQVRIMWSNKTEDGREDDTGVGLISMTLRELHPYTTYSVQVRCASNEHFWKWGDWSKEITFETKEDIPQAVDVWMTVDSNNRSLVVWKLVPEKSHGKLVKYELSWNGSVPLRLEPTQHCYSMSTDRVKRITITAMNSVGYSQPSTIISPSQARDVETTRVNGGNGGVELAWAPMPGASCGYVVDWYLVGSQDKCDIQWIKIPAGRTNTTINSGLKDGVRYTFSLYACTSDAPKLLQRWESYGRELAPDQAPGSFQGKQDGMDVVLTWDEIPLEHRRGFIQRYEIKYTLSSHGQYKTETVLGSKDGMQKRIYHLRPETYEFSIHAVTSGGKSSKPATTRVTLTSQVSQIIVYSIVSLAGAIASLLLFTFLCYQKRTWLKDKVYPEIPTPRFVGGLDAKGFQSFELPAERVEHLDASPILFSDVNQKVTNNVTHNVFFPLYRNIADSQPSDPADCKFHPSMKIPITEINNPNYKPLGSVGEAGEAAPVTTEEVTMPGYKPQLPGESSLLPLRSASSYRALEDACQGGLLESEDYISVGLVGSPTSVSSSQPLLGDSYTFGQHA